MPFSLRPVQDRDAPALNALHASVGWPRRSDAGWRWLLNHTARIEAEAPAGWLLIDETGEPRGYTGNLVQRFWRGDDALYGASGYSIVVQPPARGHSRMLLRAFAEQPGMFARYTFNANPKSSPLFPRHGLNPWPTRTHALKLAWRLDTVTCAAGRLWREVDRRAPQLVDLRHERFLNRRLMDHGPLVLPAGVAVLSDLNDRSQFGDFWNALRSEGRIIAERSPAAIRWRLSDPDRTIEPLVLAFNRGDAITGYAMAMMAKANVIEPPVLEILDLVAFRDEPRAVPALAQALLTNARALGATKVRIQVVNEVLLRQLGPLAASARREGGWGHCHVHFQPGVEGSESWTPTPFDGDYQMCLRPVPLDAAVSERAA
ncbi:GNAT family N-acetyltransferase [Brevundimonas bacteroides]|uniref:GNAT family N-acetyltransferase n=1 Tax=Brevundimonas bacteroides TaxID=74311 RepID=UPI00049543B2|nr:GNAT family N-acetyltransferase [Brevundimonas bacteroides]